MSRHAALLRGINVGGHNRIGMVPLAQLFTDLGHTEVRTYIQSGNVVYRPGPDRADAASLSAAILARFELEVPVVVRSAAALAEVYTHNPFADADPKTLFVTFLGGTPPADKVDRLDPARSPGDRFVVRGADVYLQLGTNAADTRLQHSWFERQLGTTATTRNWNTVGTLHDWTR